MRKITNIFLAVLITLFSFPFGGLNVSAEGKAYDDIADGTYELTAKLLKEGTDEVSAAAGFMSDQVTLEIKNGKAELTFFIPDNPAMEFKEFILEGEEPEIKSGTGKHDGEEVEGNYFAFPLNSVKTDLTSTVTYSVDMPPLIFDHEGVVMDIQLVGLDDLPVVEEEEQEPTPEQPEDNEKPESPEEDNEEDGKEEPEDTESGEGSEEDSGDTEGEESEDETNNLNLSNGNYTFDVSYLHSDKEETSAMANYLGDVAFVEVKDGEAELTITVTDKDAVTKLQVDGQDPVEVVEDDDNRYVRFLLNDLTETTDAYVEYQAAYGDSVFEGDADFRIVLDEETKEEAKATDKPGHDLLVTPEEKDLSLDNGLYTADVTYYHAENNKGSAMANYLGDTLFFEVEDGAVELTITIDDNESVTLLQVEKQDSVEAVVDGKKNYETFELDELTNIYNAYTEYQAAYGDSVFEGDADFRIVIDENSVETASEKDRPGYVAPEVEDDETDSGKGEGDDEKKSLTPDKAYEIDYTILHEDGNAPSVADGFFEKPGTVLEYDGKTYFQMTVESAEMVQALSNKYGDYVLVDEKDGTKTMQLRVPNDLSDMKLDMHIVVPAGAMPNFPGYDKEHGAILTFDQDSLEDVNAENYTVVATNDKDNGNAPFDGEAETPEPTPTPEDPEEDPKEDPKKDPKEDPKEKSLTPDKAYEIMYTLLHEDGNAPSVADGFFQKPGILLEYDGKTYFQMTVESAEMVKSLSNKYGDFVLVSNNEDGTMTIQLRVDNDLSDMELDMHIVVPAGAIPGFPGYDEKHGAILTFDKDSQTEISVEGLEVAASGDKNNENGPYVEGAGNGNNGKSPSKPELGDNGDKKEENDKTGNPKTGDTSQIFFFATLLMASLGVLVVQVRRRLAA